MQDSTQLHFTVMYQKTASKFTFVVGHVHHEERGIRGKERQRIHYPVRAPALLYERERSCERKSVWMWKCDSCAQPDVNGVRASMSVTIRLQYRNDANKAHIQQQQ